MTLYIDGDPYVLDHDSGEYVEQHHVGSHDGGLS